MVSALAKPSIVRNTPRVGNSLAIQWSPKSEWLVTNWNDVEYNSNVSGYATNRERKSPKPFWNRSWQEGDELAATSSIECVFSYLLIR